MKCHRIIFCVALLSSAASCDALADSVEPSPQLTYMGFCAGCHGDDRKGHVGVPNLTDKIWNWGGDIASIERTIQFGIRSKDSQTRTGVMPGFKHSDPQLSDDNINDLIEYINNLSGKKADTAAVERAKENWARCVECHGEKGGGKTEIGAPSLVDSEWLFGSDKESIVASIGEGRHATCPGGSGKLNSKTIHLLATWLVSGAE